MTNDPSTVAVITGASEGIGRALALALADARHYDALVVSARNAERLDALARELAERGQTTLSVPCDVTREADCEALITRTVERFGGLDTLFNNAGMTMWAEFESVRDTDVFRRVMDVNYYGVLYCTRAALPHIKARRGRLVLVASVAGMTGVPTRSGYAASKHAAIGLYESLRIELAPTGVSVTIVAPDFVVSQIHRRALKGDGTPLRDTPMKEGKIMSSERCAELIVQAAQARERLRITSARGRLGRFLRLIAPGLVDRIAARAIESGR